MVHEPALLIADEPTGNLDSENGVRILELLEEVNHRSGAALLLATHDAAVAAAARRTVEMRDGCILRVDSGPAAVGTRTRPAFASAGSAP